MPISEAKIREMRENSARKYAEQLAREKEQAEEYDKERKKNVSKMMSVNEKIALVAKARNEGLTINQTVEKYGIPHSSVVRYLKEAKERGLIRSGIVVAAELSESEREELTAQAEADAGIYYDGSGDNASDIACDEDERDRGPYEYGPATDEPKPTDISDIYDVARSVLGAMRSVNIPKGFDISFKIIGNSCKIDIARGDMALSSAMKWRQ